MCKYMPDDSAALIIVRGSFSEQRYNLRSIFLLRNSESLSIKDILSPLIETLSDNLGEDLEERFQHATLKFRKR